MRVVYEDALVTEYSDGTEEVRFTDREWTLMMDDPAGFGYACQALHRLSPAEIQYGDCLRCMTDSGPPDWPPATIRCGNGDHRHRSVAAVRACYGLPLT